MYQTILKKFSEDGIHLNDEQDNFLRIFEKNLPRKSFFVDFFKKKSKKGCYVHGDVGRGKTMMLNAIFKEVKEIAQIKIDNDSILVLNFQNIEIENNFENLNIINKYRLEEGFLHFD